MRNVALQSTVCGLELEITMYPTNRPFIMVKPAQLMNEMPLCINIRKEVDERSFLWRSRSFLITIEQ